MSRPKKNQYEIRLSRHDDYWAKRLKGELPDSYDEWGYQRNYKHKYFPIWNLLTTTKLMEVNPNLSVFKMTEQEAIQLRHEAYSSVRKIFDKQKSINFASYWNHNIDKITGLGENAFVRNKGLAPIAHLIECFQIVDKKRIEKDRKKVGETKNFYIHFAIRHDYLLPYFECLKNETVYEPPKSLLRMGRKPNSSAIVNQQWYCHLNTEQNERVWGDKNSLYETFCKWTELQGLTKKDAVELALKSVMEKYPIDGLDTEWKKLEKSKKGKLAYTEHELKCKTYKRGDKEYAKIQTNIEASIYYEWQKIIFNFNSDLDNTGKKKLNLNNFMVLVYNFFKNNKDMQGFILKYLQPELLKELKEIKEMQKHNLE